MMMNGRTSRNGVAVVLVLSLIAGIATCDIGKDKEKCANDLVGLAPCLQYVTVGGDQSKSTASPPSDCCAGLKQVLQKSPECICLLVKDRNDPALGFKINATRALGLPSQCHTPSANVSDCPAVLHLPPNSPDAKVFEDFANIGKKASSNSTTTTATPSADSAGNAGAGSGALTSSSTSGGGETKGKRSGWGNILGIQLVLMLTTLLLVDHHNPKFSLL